MSITQLIVDAVAAERERCAKLADVILLECFSGHDSDLEVSQELADEFLAGLRKDVPRWYTPSMHLMDSIGNEVFDGRCRYCTAARLIAKIREGPE